MNKASQLLLKGSLIGSLALLATAASAQWVPGPGCGMGMMGPGPNCGAPCYGTYNGAPCYFGQGNQMRGPAVGYQDRKLYLLGSLNLNDSQKPAWNNYSAAIDALHAQRNANQQAPGWQLSQEQRLEARVARLQQQLEATQNLIKARAELVKVLTPEQVKVLEALESKSHFRGHRGPRHHGFAPQRHHGFGPQGFGPQGAPAPIPKAPV